MMFVYAQNVANGAKKTQKAGIGTASRTAVTGTRPAGIVSRVVAGAKKVGNFIARGGRSV